VECIDGVRLDLFEVGFQYEVGNLIGAVLLAENWAEPVPSEDPALGTPLDEFAFDADANHPPNLIRETYPPYYDGPPAVALDRRRRSRKRPA